VRQDYIDLLPIVRTPRGSCRARLPETCRFLGYPIQPTTLAMQPATRTGKGKWKRHVSHKVRNLERKFAEPNANRLIAENAVVHGQRRWHGMT
jgi:hypothetical protein